MSENVGAALLAALFVFGVAASNGATWLAWLAIVVLTAAVAWLVVALVWAHADTRFDRMHAETVRRQWRQGR